MQPLLASIQGADHREVGGVLLDVVKAVRERCQWKVGIADTDGMAFPDQVTDGGVRDKNFERHAASSARSDRQQRLAKDAL